MFVNSLDHTDQVYIISLGDDHTVCWSRPGKTMRKYHGLDGFDEAVDYLTAHGYEYVPDHFDNA